MKSFDELIEAELKDFSIDIWNKVIDGYEGRGNFNWKILIDELKTKFNIKQLEKKLLRSHPVVLQMKEALEFYASFDSYYVNGAPNLWNHIDDSDLTMNQESHFLSPGIDPCLSGGKRARQALKTYEETVK